MAHRDDLAMLAAGHNRPLHPTGILGKLLRGFSDAAASALATEIQRLVAEDGCVRELEALSNQMLSAPARVPPMSAAEGLP